MVFVMTLDISEKRPSKERKTPTTARHTPNTSRVKYQSVFL